MFLPINVETLHEADLSCLTVEGVMEKDFGPWKKGEKYYLIFDFDNGTVTEYNDYQIKHQHKLVLSIK